MRLQDFALLVTLSLSAPAVRAGDFDFLFIHHSVGNNWLRDGLRSALQDPKLNQHVFRVHDATYGDTIGQQTDVCNWYPKFRDQMNLVRTFDFHPNHYYTKAGRYNRIIMFKSCFPNSGIHSTGTAPGNPTNCSHTIWNHKAAYLACAEIFRKYPNTLFVAVTAPPLNPASTSKADAARARQFHTWLATTWVQDYRAKTGLKNLACFNLFDILANPPNHPTEPNMLRQAYRKGTDSHPTAAGNIAATKAFIPFINAAVNTWLTPGTGGCPGTGGKIPSLLYLGNPKIGNSSFALSLSQGKPGSPALLVAGSKSTSVSLGGGCTLKVGSPLVPFATLLDTKGGLRLPLPIPSDPALVGGHVHMQFFVYDPAGPIGPGVLAGSNGLDLGITN